MICFASWGQMNVKNEHFTKISLERVVIFLVPNEHSGWATAAHFYSNEQPSVTITEHIYGELNYGEEKKSYHTPKDENGSKSLWCSMTTRFLHLLTSFLCVKFPNMRKITSSMIT